MTTRQITGLIHNADGSTTAYSGSFTETENPVFGSLTVVPPSGPPGTPRTITVVGTDPNGLALTYEMSVDGVALAPTPVPGVFVWGG